MATINYTLEIGHPIDNDYPVYCTACPRRCLLYYLARTTAEENKEVTVTDVPETCPIYRTESQGGA